MVKEQLQNCYEYLLNKNYKDIRVYDLTKENTTFRYALVASIDDVIANKNNASSIMADFDFTQFPEGFHKGEWIIFDFDELVIHLFIPKVREKYNLDKLWQLNKMDIK